MQDLSQELGSLLLQKKWQIATAESCTAGLISAAITSVAGSSAYFDRSFVTYSNTAKSELLDIELELINRVGAVSEEVARAMVAGAIKQSMADVALSVTGIAGPDGGSDDKPVGTVWFGLALPDRPIEAHCEQFEGDRKAIRESAVKYALNLLINRIKEWQSH